MQAFQPSAIEGKGGKKIAEAGQLASSSFNEGILEGMRESVIDQDTWLTSFCEKQDLTL